MKNALKKTICGFLMAVMMWSQAAFALQATNVVPDGTGLSVLNGFDAALAAVVSSHSGSSAPIYAVAGTVWLDNSATPWKFKAYDGADWITLGEVNATTNTFQPYNGTAPPRLLNYAADTGTANAYVIAPSPAVTAYTAGLIVTLKPAHANTGASNINVNSLGTVNIKLLDGSDPAANAMVTTGVYWLINDGTNFVLLNPSTSTTTTLTGAVFGSGTGTVATSLSASIVANSNMANMAGNTIKANNTASSAAPSDVSLSAAQVFGRKSSGNLTGLSGSDVLDLLGTTQGSIAYRNATTWTVLTPGTSGQFLQTQGSSANPQWASGSGITAPSAIGLKVKNNGTTPNTKIDVSATTAVLTKSDGTPILVSSPSVTIDATTVGANGLDAGALANATWYYVYLISNGTTTAGLASTSSTAPTLPSGYTYSMRVGAFLTDGSAHFLSIYQLGRRAQYTSAIVMSSGVQGNYSTPTWVAVTVNPNYVPPTAVTIIGSVHSDSSSTNAVAAPNSGYGGGLATSNIPPVYVSGFGANYFEFTLESTSIDWASSNANCYLNVHGWVDSVNAS